MSFVEHAVNRRTTDRNRVVTTVDPVYTHRWLPNTITVRWCIRALAHTAARGVNQFVSVVLRPVVRERVHA